MPNPVAPKAPLTREQLEALGEEIATFDARMTVAMHALLTRLRTFDAHEGWGPQGFLSTAHWLSWRVGLGLKAARERVRVARALADLPKVDALFARGELSYSKVRAITRVATAETEQTFIDIAMDATASQIERLFRNYERVIAIGDQSPAEQAAARRYVRRIDAGNGMVKVEALLPREEADLLFEAIESADERAPGASAGASAEVPREQRRADALVDIARAYLKQQPRTLGSGYELVLLTTKSQLERGEHGIGGFLPDGTPVPIGVARMLASDAPRVDVVVGEQGELLDVGRRTRTIPSAIARALWLRDGCCRVPGCGRKRHLHGHHIQHWAAGGPTRLDNLVLVCSGHHRMIHEGTLRAELRDDEVVFSNLNGNNLVSAPPSAATGRDLDELDRFLAQADLRLDPSVNMPRWDGRRMDLADSLAWMLMGHGGSLNTVNVGPPPLC